MNRRHSLKQKIKKKFGSFSEFARQAGIDRYELQRNFLTCDSPTEEWVSKLESLANTLTPKLKFELLSDEKLEWLQEAINKRGGVLKFCRESGFSHNTIFHVVGKYKPGTHKGKKLITPIVKKLIAHLEESEIKADETLK